MVQLLEIPEWQFVDQDGAPIIGTVATYIPGTLTAKATFSDSLGLSANTNPVNLDAAGRCSMWANGDVRCIVKDALGNLIYDMIAMAPYPASSIGAIGACLAQPTFQSFMDCSGITAAIDNAVSGATTLVGPTGPVGPQGVTGPTGPVGATGSSASVQSSLTSPGYVLFGDYGNAIMINFGTTATDGTGHGTATFAKPFSTTVVAVNATCFAPEGIWANTTAIRNGGFDFITMSPYAPGSTFIGNIGAGWMAIGW